MAQYVVIQDIEAEDKLFGPLSMRQFIYGAIALILLFLGFKLFFVQPLFVIVILPPAALFAVLAAPFGHDQSSEIWLLAKIRFFLKPQRRIWDQSGLQEMVTVTAPKRVEHQETNGLNQDQVKSRLEALAQTIDTRGWVVKGVDVNMFVNPSYAAAQTDRLVDASILNGNEVAAVDVKSGDDILDERNNPVAQQMDQLVKAKDQSHRQALLDQIRQAQTAPATQDVTTGGSGAVIAPQPYVQPTQSYATAEPPKIQQFYTPNPAPKAAADPMANKGKPGILELARNDDLSVATIARQAHRDESASGEVVISLR